MNQISKTIAGESILRFADIEILRYAIPGWEALPLERKLLIYHLSEATLAGRDIIFDQHGRYNLRLRYLCEEIYQHYPADRESSEWQGFVEYLRRLWFSSGIHHHYGSEKFVPAFSESFLRSAIKQLQTEQARLLEFDERELGELCREVFDPSRSPKRTEQSGDADLVRASSVNFYDEGVSEHDAVALYEAQAEWASEEEKVAPPSYGLNSRLARNLDGELYEDVYRIGGLYGTALEAVSQHLKAALAYVDSPEQREAILALLHYYKTGELESYNKFCITWVQDTSVQVDFINGFTEVYSDPLGIKGSWEGLVHIKNEAASQRTEKICAEAGWFERHAPIDERFKKAEPVGVSATVVDVAMLGGDSYPATPIGINLPNADWIRARYGSKSVTISNIHEAYRIASRGNGMDELFVPSPEVRELLNRYDGLTDELHTDLHECLGHGSGQLLPGVSPDALGAYHSVLEEARADLFALYYMADEKLLELGLLPDAEAYKACYYRYLLNGLVTQLVRIKLGADIEEAHMRNRALIARYALERGGAEGTISLEGLELKVHDYLALRGYFAELLREVQRIKSEGDQEAARQLTERYAIKIDRALHAEVLRRYETLNLAPYRGFVNPKLELVWDEAGDIADVRPSYSEGYDEQMLRYSREYGFLPLDPVGEMRISNPQASEASLAEAKTLRTQLRGSMDGIVSSSMREKGLHYGINFGLTMEHIHARAKGLSPSADLARYLLGRDVRELKLIGQIIYPAEELSFAEATYIAERSFSNPELRDCLCKHLFDRTPSAPQWALAWLRGGLRYADIHAVAYIVLARYFTRGYELESRAQAEYLLSEAFALLSEASDYVTSEQRSALLMLKRWGRHNSAVKAQILAYPRLAEWNSSGSCVLMEFADDLQFELSYED